MTARISSPAAGATARCRRNAETRPRRRGSSPVSRAPRPAVRPPEPLVIDATPGRPAHVGGPDRRGRPRRREAVRPDAHDPRAARHHVDGRTGPPRRGHQRAPRGRRNLCPDRPGRPAGAGAGPGPEGHAERRPPGTSLVEDDAADGPGGGLPAHVAGRWSAGAAAGGRPDGPTTGRPPAPLDPRPARDRGAAPADYGDPARSAPSRRPSRPPARSGRASAFATPFATRNSGTM